MNYSIKYTAHNTYDSPVGEALWQFLIIPEDNATQLLSAHTFTNSQNIYVQESANGFGFKTYRVHARQKFREIDFEAVFKLEKKSINPFSQVEERDIEADLKVIDSLDFKVEYEPYLKDTSLTKLPNDFSQEFRADPTLPLFENIKALNGYIFENFKFQPGLTGIDTDLADTLKERKGVCQDFTHLFCALSRKQKIPTRYVSGYLHQGRGYKGDSQMHAWAECYLPGMGWTGFDPTNNLIAAANHIKVAHGKDYTDCPPIKGLIYTSGTNTTVYTVEVHADQNEMSQTQDHTGMSQRMGGVEQKMKPLKTMQWGSIQQQQ